MLRSIVLPLLLCLLWLSAAAAAAPESAAGLSATERERVLSLGPWPPAFRPDPSNRVSGDKRAIELGRRLFNDPRMSPVGYIACVTCHQTDRAFTDHKARAHGLGDLPRNTPTLANLGQQRWFGWGGASDSLWMASLRPMVDAREFDSNAAVVARIYRRVPELAACYRAVFKSSPHTDAERTMVNTAKALAAFQETLVTGRTAFDDYRDAVARADAPAAHRYPPAARRGLLLFVGSAGCVQCHAGPTLSDGRFHQVAVPDTAADQGRFDDLATLRASAFTRFGRYSDRPAARPAPAADADRFAFRTPSLRQVSVTAPYLHDGRVDELQAAVGHGDAQRQIDAAQRADLVAFLHTLTDRHGERRPASVQPRRCP